MISLLLATLCNAALSIVMRFSEGKIRSRIAMLAANYLTCALMACCFSGLGNLFPAADGMGRALGLGMLNGMFYMTALLAMQYNIRRNGVVLPSVFSKTGALLVPLVISVLLFSEFPSAFQTAGFALAVAAILLMNYRRGGSAAASMPSLIVLLFTEGLASSMAKVYRELGNPALSDHFLLFTFASAFAVCILLMLRRGERMGVKELLFGASIGIPNFMGARFVLKALETLPSAIVYPFRSVGSIVIVALAGTLLFRERLNKRQIAAMLIIFAALILLNL